ncbi:copper resistance CopC family protein [Microbacterium terricola]|uniref:copper resistance CopC family protein n=1 Tax=Microbacterium terricola TaxID=344163 RepID=UPI0021E8D8CD|nr:copper resistance CopC family protein [Microbacterium terricola]UYK38932.1 copper resistance protein CopC [Microbacterium terricola]
MSHGIHNPRSRRALGAIAAALIAGSAVLFSAAPASAHDELLSTDPADGSTAAAMPEQITFTFSANISPDDGATEIAATDAGGTSVLAGDPVVQDNTVTQPLAAGGSGEITVLWKVVSSDGHPISGEFAFTVEAAEPTASASAAPTATASGSASASAQPSETPSPTATTAGDEAGSSSALPWIIGGGIALAVVAAVVYLVVRRPRTSSSSDQ